ncbi:MAG: S8 family serine peptidase [Lachnospiraceae bacterium]|nr:S8 family serine peptidase [Lachnospiraceae bacterium]
MNSSFSTSVSREMFADGSAQRQTQPALSEEYSDMIVRTAPGGDLLSLSGIPTYLRGVFDSRADFQGTAVLSGTEAVQPVNEQYTIIYAPLSDHLSTVEEIGYSSVPKVFTEINVVSLEAAGILSVRIQPFLELSGKGVLIGFLDSGIDCTHPAFRHADGTTRIVRLWDQDDTTGVPPEGILYGSEYTEEDINRALFGGTGTADAFLSGSGEAADRGAAPWIPGTDPTGHGTAVAGIACGSVDAGEGFTGAAPESAIAFVRLKPAKQYLRDYFRIPEDAVAYQENDLMVGVRYLLDCARNLKMPLVICLSLGTSQGGHTGNTPLENVLESASEVPGVCAVAGTGNETGLAHHIPGSRPWPVPGI